MCAGADLTLKDTGGKTAFMAASQTKRYKVIEELNKARDAFDDVKVAVWHINTEHPEGNIKKICEKLETDGYDRALQLFDEDKRERMLTKYGKDLVLGCLIRLHQTSY